MKSTKGISASVLLLFFGMSVPARARQEKPKEESRPAKQQQQAGPEKQQQSQAPKQPQEHQPHQAPAPKREQDSRSERPQQAGAPQQQARPEKQHEAQGHQQQSNSAKQPQQARTQQQQPRQQQARSLQAPQRTQQAVARQRSAPALRLSVRGSGRIPDDRFRSHFGREHAFRIGTPVLVGGYSRFQYGGFWFGFVEPWPPGWYYTDDVYIDYVDGGYYMYNPYYPGARFSISVVI